MQDSAAAGADGRWPSIDVIVCSIDDQRFRNVSDNLHTKLNGVGLRRIIRVDDACAMHDGYNRGAALSDADWLLFCHDDIAVLDLVWQTWRQALETTDVFGPCGTDCLQGPNWYEASPNHLHGSIVAPTPDRAGFEHQVFGKQGPLVRGAQALDGLFIMSRRSVWDAIRFSDEFAGFTLYDIDFTYRAYLLGRRVAVLTDLLLLHDSHVANFSADKVAAWEANQAVFVNKFAFRRRGESYVKHDTVRLDGLPDGPDPRGMA